MVNPVRFFDAGFLFDIISQTLLACRAMQLRFSKVETLLNNAFNPNITKCTCVHCLDIVFKRNIYIGFPGQF